MTKVEVTAYNPPPTERLYQISGLTRQELEIIAVCVGAMSYTRLKAWDSELRDETHDDLYQKLKEWATRAP